MTFILNSFLDNCVNCLVYIMLGKEPNLDYEPDTFRQDTFRPEIVQSPTSIVISQPHSIPEINENEPLLGDSKEIRKRSIDKSEDDIDETYFLV